MFCRTRAAPRQARAKSISLRVLCDTLVAECPSDRAAASSRSAKGTEHTEGMAMQLTRCGTKAIPAPVLTIPMAVYIVFASTTARGRTTHDEHMVISWL